MLPCFATPFGARPAKGPLTAGGTTVHNIRYPFRMQVGLPDQESRLAIFQVKLQNAPVAPTVDLSGLAALCDGMSGADISELCRRACQLALRYHLFTVLVFLVHSSCIVVIVML